MASRFRLGWMMMMMMVVVGCGNDGETQGGVDAGAAGSAGLGGSGGAAGAAGSGGAAGAGGSAGAAGVAGAAGSAGTGGAAGASGAGQGGSLPPPPCPTFDDGIENGTVASDDIDEASGMVWSRRNTDVLWVHNDSGDSARVFALDVTGTYLGEFSLPGQNARDWEDMTLGPGPEAGADYLYLGDIGDNNEVRADIVVFRAKEPLLDLSSTPVTGTLDDFVGLRFTYPGGNANNAETLLSDPATGDLYIVTKKSSGNSGVYRAAAPHDASATTELESVAMLHFGQAPLSGSTLTTAGDITADGSWISIRTYGRAYAWYRAPGTPLWEAFDGDPCPLPLRSEPQGETFAWSPEGERYVTVSENSSQPIYLFSLVP